MFTIHTNALFDGNTGSAEVLGSGGRCRLGDETAFLQSSAELEKAQSGQNAVESGATTRWRPVINLTGQTLTHAHKETRRQIPLEMPYRAQYICGCAIVTYNITSSSWKYWTVLPDVGMRGTASVV
jgi:hypothetical protein